MSLKSSQSPRAKRDSTQDPLEHAQGTVRDSGRPINKTGGEGNENAWAQSSDLNMESVNSRAHKPRG